MSQSAEGFTMNIVKWAFLGTNNNGNTTKNKTKKKKKEKEKHIFFHLFFSLLCVRRFAGLSHFSKFCWITYNQLLMSPSHCIKPFPALVGASCNCC